ncbi:MAG: glycoside hydrolase family 30 protein [Bacteroidaceae bacterium]|nr:glycoside hydrolase family 30 protein [Bacteroidaceae bacterium]
MRKIVCIFSLIAAQMSAQTFTQYTTTEEAPWQQKGKTSLATKAKAQQMVNAQWSMVNRKPFRAWGTCFNELDLDAIRLLTPEEQDKIMHDIFAPDGDLRFTRGRLSMNANDYSRAWYSCDTVAGDFALKYFNIEHDKENVIRLIKMAQRWQPEMTFWVSPWSPPSWMKINQDYCVASSPFNTQPKEKDYLLFDDGGVPDPDEMQFNDGQRGHLFPRKLASQNYFIQDQRYLQAYANMFCKFIDLYAAEDIPIDMVMYQNEAYSYTPYPGCAWTAEGTIKFNKEYLAPALKEKHPEVKLYVGTFNTNRQDYVQRIVNGLQGCVEGLGFQWEGRENLDFMREKHPDLHMVSSESECGNGQMDWRAGEHTFYLLHEYIGRGCDEYYNWNFILCDQGRSAWGWKQNALVQVRSANRTYRYTPEYYAYKHFSHFVEPGSTLLAFCPMKEGLQAIVFRRPDNRRVVICGNAGNEAKSISIEMAKGKYLNATLAAHSFNTFVEK